MKINLVPVFGLLLALETMAQPLATSPQKQSSQKPVMLMNRIAPSVSALYVANTDGSGEHKLLTTDTFDYHASFSADGRWIVFTSERVGDGQADIYPTGRVSNN